MAEQQRKRGRNKRKKTGMCGQDRPTINARAAGIDIGAREIRVAVAPDYATSRCGFSRHSPRIWSGWPTWLTSLGISTAAMESTGVYWIPLYEILEKRKLQPCLVNARHMKNVPGRRTDWHDCQWLQYLHSVGLLRAAFRPEDQICAARAIMRHRGELVQMSAEHIPHIQKSLTQMNVQLHHVINDITGTTGLAIVDAIVNGERDAGKLAALRHYRIQADEETIRKSLKGNWRPEHLFTLRQSRDFYRYYQQQIEQCDRELETLLGEFEARVDPGDKPLPPDRKKRRKRSGRNVASEGQGPDLRTELYKLYGVDVLQIPGVEHMGLSLFTEIGRDLTRFPTAGHFVSWLGLCPDNDQSGGKYWRAARPVMNRAGQLFRMAAYPLHRSLTPLGAYLRRMKYKLGPAGATMATARKIAVIFYTMVKGQIEYDESLWTEQEQERQKRLEAKLKRQAEKLGFQLVPLAS